MPLINTDRNNSTINFYHSDSDFGHVIYSMLNHFYCKHTANILIVFNTFSLYKLKLNCCPLMIKCQNYYPIQLLSWQYEKYRKNVPYPRQFYFLYTLPQGNIISRLGYFWWWWGGGGHYFYLLNLIRTQSFVDYL